MGWPDTALATGELIPAATLNRLPIILDEADGAAASYDFTGIPGIWTHLLFVCQLQTGAGASHDDVKVKFNNDAAAKYYDQRGRATGNGTPSAAEALTATSAKIGSVSGQATGGFSSMTFWVPNYAAVQPHSFHSSSFSALGVSTGNLRVELYGGLWKPTVDVAINEVTFTPSAGSFVAGSIITMYGMGLI